MHSSNNRRNHDFQIAHFLAGACHTADGAYALLCDLREERLMALNSVKASKLREQAKIVQANRKAQSEDEVERLEGEADLAEIEASRDLVAKNLAAAEAELAFIEQCIERVQPHRKFAHLPDPEAHEACQREEWRLELEYRAVNCLVTAGTIPADHFATMRQHPDFASSILPTIHRTRALMAEGKADVLLTQRPIEKLLIGATACMHE